MTPSPWSYPWTPSWTANFWAPAFLGALCIAVVAACYLVELRGVAFWRRVLFTLLRSAAILLLGWMLLGWTWTPYVEEPSELLLLIDVSQSMSTEDVVDEANSDKQRKSRLAAAKSRSDTLLPQLAKRYRLRIASIGGAVNWLSSDAARQRETLKSLASSAPATRLGDAIEQALQVQRGKPTAAMILLSDGVQTEGVPIAAAAANCKRAGAPLFILGLGDDRPPQDVRISNLIYSPTAFLGDVVNIEADLQAEGFQEINVRVLLKNEADGKVIAEETTTLHAGQTSRVRLPVRPKSLGPWRFTLEAEKPPKDASPQNNIASGVIRVQEETVRVLLVDRQPRYDFRYLTDLLQRARKHGAPSEPAFELKTYLQEGDVGISRQDPVALDAFPDRQSLQQFDVILLGDIDLSLLGAAHQRSLLEATTRGGAGLVILPAADSGFARWQKQPLELLLPSRAAEAAAPLAFDEPISAAPTPLGSQIPFCLLGDKPDQSAAAWKTLPPFFGVISAPQLPPQARVLVETKPAKNESASPSPLVTLHFTGASKILCHWTDEWWRWAGPDSRRYYDQYWMQAIRFLCSTKTALGEQSALLRTDAATYLEGQPARFSLQFRDQRDIPSDDAGAILSLVAGDREQQVVLSRDASRGDLFTGSASNLPPGAYLAKVLRPPLAPQSENECRFEIAPRASEMARLRPDFAELRAAASLSGGKFYTLDTASNLPDDLPERKNERTSPLPPRGAWNLPIWALLLVGLFTAEWFLRRASGLL